MPNIISQEISSSGIKIIANNGKSIDLSFETIKSRHGGEVGSPVAKRALVIAWFRQNLFDNIGGNLIKREDIDFDFGASGNVTKIKIGRNG